MAGPAVLRSTPHQIVIYFPGAGVAFEFSYTDLLNAAVPGPLKDALVAAQGQTTTAFEAIECLMGGSLALPSLSSGFSDIQTTNTFTQPSKEGCIVAGVDLVVADSPRLLVLPDAGTGSSGEMLIFVTHRWSPTV